MEGWKVIYQALIAVVLIFALYNVFIISNIHHRDDDILIKHTQDLLQTELKDLTNHLKELESNQREFNDLVQGVDQYIETFKNRPRPKSPVEIHDIPINEPVIQLPVPDVPKLKPVKINNEVKSPENQMVPPKNYDPIPVLVIACNRPTVSRALDSIINARNHFKSSDFPILVSQDCGDAKTKSVIMQYSSNHEDIQYTEQLDRSEFPNAKRTMQGYYKLRNEGWTFSSVFFRLIGDTKILDFCIIGNNEIFDLRLIGHRLFPKSPAVIIVEDDLEVSPDILSYFRRMSELLFDPNENLFCISAWNDNGKDHQINSDPMLVHRTDFFGGLGWMLRRDIWENEWAEKWPQAYWDDWVRDPNQRRGRQCIRPEVPRTSTFGKIGVSGGQFFDQHLSKIHELHKWIDWNSFDLDSLRLETFDREFLEKVSKLPTISVYELPTLSEAKVNSLGADGVKIIYKLKTEFVLAAKRLQIMDDLKAGVPRGGYRGIVSTIYNNVQVYLSPADPATWEYTEKF